jgi:hypothetical protein
MATYGLFAAPHAWHGQYSIGEAGWLTRDLLDAEWVIECASHTVYSAGK